MNFKWLFSMKEQKKFMEEQIGLSFVTLTPVINIILIISMFIKNNGIIYDICAFTYSILLLIFSAIIDMFVILKRLGVKKYKFQKRDKFYKEFFYLLKYGCNLWEGRIGSIDGEAAYTRNRYTSLFYDRYIENNNINGGDNWLMVKGKKKRVYSKSFIMKNNIPDNLTDKKICETWREPMTDIIYYGSLTIMNIVFYSWYFLIK